MDTEVTLHCTYPACVLVAVNKAGLTNHTRQKNKLLFKVHESALQEIISLTWSS